MGWLHDLAAAADACAAAEVLVDHLVAAGIEMPSIYLERGGRLRCQASRGYWQVLDGFPPGGTGVLSRVFRLGQPIALRTVSADQRFVAAVPGVVAEVCVPLRLDGRVVGGLNAEARGPLPEGVLDILLAAAAAYSERLAELGGAPGTSRWQELARFAAELACLHDRAAVESASLAALAALSGLESGMLVTNEGGGHRVRAHCGTLGSALSAVDEAGLAAIEGWLGPATSVYTLGQPGGLGFTGQDQLRTAGCSALVVLALTALGRRTGFLLAADTDPRMPVTDDVELLELLATQVAASLATVDVVEELRRRALTDSLTGLGHHAAFSSALAELRKWAGTERQVAVLVVDVDGFKRVNDDRGHPAGDAVLRAMAEHLAGALRDGDQLFRIGGDEFAGALLVRDAAEAHGVAERLRVAARATGRTVSIGVALARPEESDAALQSRADVALYAAKASGRDAVRLAAGLADDYTRTSGA